MAERDHIDDKLAVWQRELPSLDLETEGIVDRVSFVAKALRRSLNETAEEYGLTTADWGLLGALRGVGAPYSLTAGELAESVSVTPGAMTARLDRLEERGWVRRTADPHDRRVQRIELTNEGYERWGSAVEMQAAKEQLVARALSAAEKKKLNVLLRKLVTSLEP